MQKLDPEDIKIQPGENQRVEKRKSLINSFLRWSYKERKSWDSVNNEERIIINRQFAYARMLFAFGLFADFAIYNFVLTGIYNYR